MSKANEQIVRAVWRDKNNCLLIFIPRFLIIFIGIKYAVFLFL